MKRTYVIIMDRTTEEIRIAGLPAGQRPAADPRYRCHGPFRSAVAAGVGAEVERTSRGVVRGRATICILVSRSGARP
jgi:hypothetical protein